MDLGEEWKLLTGLPFVFALWAGPEGIASERHSIALSDSLDAGLAHLPEIAERFLWEGSAHPAIVLPYLRDNMKYRLQQPERDGLLRFYLLAGRHHLIDDVPDLIFFGEPVADGALH